jgi:crotonobetainyl-CoA:carnitine CoA-transferase CaiB-like acyl-CoA transferase
VTKIEQPGKGDHTRAFGPFPDGATDQEKSATFFYLNTSKRSVVLDLDEQENREVLAALVARSDIVVASATAEALDAQGIGFEQIQAWNPRVVLTTVTGFGSYGPHSSYGSSHLVACAVGGWSQLCGMPDREPLQVGGSISETLTGSFAAAASLLAILGRETHGRGDHVDLSVQEAVIAGASMPTLLYEYYGILPERYSNVGSGAGAAFIMPTDKGYVGLNALTAAQWRLMCEFLGRKDIVEDPKYHGISWARPDETLEEVRAAFKEALAGRTAEELFHLAHPLRFDPRSRGAVCHAAAAGTGLFRAPRASRIGRRRGAGNPLQVHRR